MTRTKTEELTWQDIAEAVARQKQLERERELLAQMRFEEKIREVVIVCSPANKYKLKEAIPSLFVVGSSACEDDKCYMVTDKELAEQLKKAVKW